jgi:hypothetical protein
LIAHVRITSLGFDFSISLGLHGRGFEIEFMPTTLNETNENFRLLGLQIFPYLASVREANYPGYMVIPDGTGALIRTSTRYDTTIQADYYGSDLGYRRTSVAQLSVPVTAMIQHVHAYGVMHDITSGAQHTTMFATTWGRSTRYHRLANRFNLRRIYRNIINRAGDGNDVIPEEFVTTPFRQVTTFLAGNDANYVGVARTYQERLLANGILTPSSRLTTPMHVAFLQSEQEPTFFGTRRIDMTTNRDVETMVETLKANGVEAVTMSLHGWSRDGFVHYAPYRTRFVDETGIRRLVGQLEPEDSIYLHQGYLLSSALSRRVDFNRDVARNYSRLKMSFSGSRRDNANIQFYYLYPHLARAMMQRDMRDLNRLGIHGLHMEDVGRILYSYFDGTRQTRTDTLLEIETMLSLMNGFALSRPHVYTWGALDHYLDMPITNAQLSVYTDLVPFIPIMLNGIIPMYTPHLNFNALGKQRLLQMIDFGLLPSYLLTEQPSSTLRFTYANRFYTTAFSDFEDDMIAVYNYINTVQSATRGARVVSRTMLTIGVSEVVYDNGVTVVVNYRNQPFVYQGETIPASEVGVYA